MRSVRSFLTTPVTIRVAKVAFHYLLSFSGHRFNKSDFYSNLSKSSFSEKLINLLIFEQVSCNHLFCMDEEHGVEDSISSKKE